MSSREYRDPSGVVWEVFEVHRLNDRPNTVRPALSSGWLAFVSRGEKRRLPQYPPDWIDLSDDELHELMKAAFIAPDPVYPVPRAGGDVTAPDRRDTARLVERRKRPRLTPPATPAVTSMITPSAITGPSLPVPPQATVSAALGAAGIEQLVRTHAREARQNGLAVIEGMIGVKRALTEAGADVSPEIIKPLRKFFVDEFYFSR